MADASTRSRPSSTPADTVTSGAGFGTFAGVYTPSILTILGVIMYLRFGWVVGNVGLIGALIIVTICTSITFFTALSMAAIATDRRVRAGGAYFMISRSLGIETGGAVGIPVYFALALSVALYTIGFAESVVRIFPQFDQRWLAMGTTVVVAALAIISSRLAIRSQYFVMAIIAISLISFFLGRPVEETSLDLTGAPPRMSESFWVVLAVFFPAVTGIEAGVNMSGDLKNPQRSIPIGTMAALATGYLVYMTLPIFLSLRADPETLIADPLIMRRMALWGDAILLGVWGATLSSAMGSILGAPRVLQALARDGVLPGPLHGLGRGSGADDAPRLATLFTLGIALIAVFLGDLNAIAPVLSMFFLTSYMTVNLAAGIEGFLKSPSYRPAFRVHWIFSIVGALACLAVMFLINAIATVVAAVVVLGVYLWLERRGLESAWGDVRRGLWMSMIRIGLFRLDNASDSKNWRPHILVLSGAPTHRWHLIELADTLTHGRGVVTVSSVLPEGFGSAKRQAALEGTIREHLDKRGVQALVRLVSAPDPFEGGRQLVETYGLGPLVPNTIILGDSEQPSHREAYCRMVAAFHRARRNVVIMRDDPERGFGEKQRIDVWWGGLHANGGLMMLLAYLLRTSVGWTGAEVHVKLVVPSAAAAAAAQANLESIIASLRIGAVARVIIADGRPFPLVLRQSSEDADLIFLGVAEPDENFAAYYTKLHAMVLGLPSCIFVLAGQEVAFSEVLL
ncbi:MAG: amino acid permease [Gemmatimonadetes bacterium]|nr:amino acid permease [Gemmatimonadota bacterium]